MFPAVRVRCARGSAAILCVDDEEQVLQALQRLLRDDYRVLTARSGIEGIELLRREPVSVIISDYAMPGLHGAAFLSLAHELCPDAVGIIVSGSTHTCAIDALVDAGEAYAFVEKPWKDGELKVLVQCALESRTVRTERHHLRRELQQLGTSIRALERLLDDLPHGMIKVEATGVVSWTSRPELLGSLCTCAPAIGASYLDALAPPVARLVEQALSGAEPPVGSGELRLLRLPNGAVLLLEPGRQPG